MGSFWRGGGEGFNGGCGVVEGGMMVKLWWLKELGGGVQAKRRRRSRKAGRRV